MIRAIASTLLLSGLGAAALAATPAELQFNNAPEVYSYSSGGRSYLGVDIEDVSADRVGPLKLKEERGVEVTTVDQDAPAGKAGIREHDVILQFNGTAVESEEQLRRMLRETPPGRNVTLGLSRDGNPLTITLQLADRGKIASSVKPKIMIPRVRVPEVEVPGFALQMQTYSSVLGVQTENLSRQLGEYFGVKNGEGVLVRSVEKGSAAEKAGLKAGDVIVRADNEKLSDRADLSQVLRNHREGGKITLGIVRDKHEQTVVVDLPNRSSDDSMWWFPSQEFQSGWNEFQNEFQHQMQEMINEVEPQASRARQVASAQVQAALQQARMQVHAMTPEVRAAVRRAQENIRHAQRMMEQHRRELRRAWSDMI
ncbi:MAG TPA: PDZ domain-containing protein [Candidatus Angelobacter sp.]|nr:PDZ domain-containing protein [Candidatus Angelobacter sp.]